MVDVYGIAGVRGIRVSDLKQIPDMTVTVGRECCNCNK